ncbi:MAG: hypothetical protein JNK15_19400 [Planctomycetes bacterium]|nr:hypothetical protein [Planctomycetota bacterium]
MSPHPRAVPSFATAFAIAIVAQGAHAQCPPGAPMPRDLTLETTVPEGGAADVRWRAAKDAQKANDLTATQKHLLAALEFHPSSPALLFDLAQAFRTDKDLGPLWAERFVRAAADAQGRVKFDPAQRKTMGTLQGFETSLKPHLDLALARANAIQELARFVDKQKVAAKGNAPRALLVRWAAEALLEAGLGAPQALGAVAAAVAKAQESFVAEHATVCDALLRVVQAKVPTAGSPEAAGVDIAKLLERRVRAARLLLGLRRQAGLKDLKGPPPADVSAWADAAQKALDDHAASAGWKVWTIAELEAMTPEQRLAFTHDHREWNTPGLAMSSTGRYRIETTCGHTTLLETAKTVELHHARLVAHFGADPFVERPGVVRVVPGSDDLETEGAPYWWAGGFQGGDRTVLRFSWGNIPGLGRGLTHELTHRFDGVLHPFVGAWYAEGHASWTGAHYGKMAATDFVESYLDSGTVAHTYYKGYGGKEKFVELLTGKIAEYRDNYFAGYSLYAFLRSFPPSAPKYREPLARFERNARGGQKDPLAFFTSHFADGKDGRPAKFDDLHAEWHAFVKGCYDAHDDAKKAPEWLRSYGDRGEGDPAPPVMDEPTWSWERNRAEPFWGQDHAAAATLLLHEVGDVDGTIAAGTWSLTVDGFRPETCAAMLAALRATKATDAAAAFAVLARRHFPALGEADGTALLAALPKCKALLDGQQVRVRGLASEAASAAAALADDHARLAGMFGLRRMTDAPTGAPPQVPRHLGGHGFTESELTGFQDRRHAGLWYPTPLGDLHVGREKPREATGSLDRRAHQRDAFVHTVAWLAPGHYVLRGRVHFTTSYVSGAIVFGHTRRDRDLRLQFSSGDFDYATGRSEQNRSGGSVGFDLRGLWERDGNMPNEADSRSIKLADGQPGFTFELDVRGPRVAVTIDGKPLLRYAVHDGSPIEGHVGFAMGMGAVRVELPTVQRFDGELADVVGGLDLTRQPTVDLEELLLLPVRGVPLHANGTLVLLVPKEDDAVATEVLPRVLPVLASLLQNTLEHPQPWVLALPKNMPENVRAAAKAMVEEVRKAPLPQIDHDVKAPFATGEPWVLFVDAHGVLRAACGAFEPGVHTRVRDWARKLRAR